jgi:hypothetical protein
LFLHLISSLLKIFVEGNLTILKLLGQNIDRST